MDLVNNRQNANNQMLEVIKVNVSALVGIFIAQYNNLVENIIGLSEAGSAVITFLIVLSILIYNVFKVVQMMRETKWHKEDREEEKSE